MPTPYIRFSLNAHPEIDYTNNGGFETIIHIVFMGVLFTYHLLVNFGRWGKELTHDVKNVIVNLSNKVHSSYNILGITDVHRRSVSIIFEAVSWTLKYRKRVAAGRGNFKTGQGHGS